MSLKFSNIFCTAKEAIGLLVLFILIITFGLSEIFFLKSKVNKLQQEFKDVPNKIYELNKDLNLCNQNRGRIVTSYKLPYSPDDFMISSALFEGKDINVNEWFYKNQLIYEMTIILNQGNSSPIHVKVWKHLTDTKNRDRVIFDMAGNSYPILVLPTEVKTYNTFSFLTDKGKITLIRQWGELDLFQYRSVGAYSIYVQIIDPEKPAGDDESIIIPRSTKRIEPIAKQIIF